METIHRIYNLIVLDESGSMASIKKAAITGFNELAQNIKGLAKKYPEQEHSITLVTFNGLDIKTLLFNKSIEELNEFNDTLYQPDSMTPLFDAMGLSINKLRKEITSTTDYNVLVTIITDGEENASKEYNRESIKALVDELRQKNWTFTYIGANHDVEKVAAQISINNSINFTASAQGVDFMFARENRARTAYYDKVSKKSKVDDNYFSDDEPENETTENDTKQA